MHMQRGFIEGWARKEHAQELDSRKPAKPTADQDRQLELELHKRPAVEQLREQQGEQSRNRSELRSRICRLRGHRQDRRLGSYGQVVRHRQPGTGAGTKPKVVTGRTPCRATPTS